MLADVHLILFVIDDGEVHDSRCRPTRKP